MTPNNLWNKNILYQSTLLVDIYKDKLKELSIYEHAKQHTQKTDGATGGKDANETKKHFAERFLTSSARTQFVLLDPREDFKEISVNLKSTFGGGKISVLDIPAGTGAGILSLLSNLSELRISGMLPKLPLYINILAGDYSSSALKIYNELLSEIKISLEEQLIFISYDIFEWNASEPRSTNLLIKKFLKNEDDYEEHYVFMSAFSGVGSKNYKSFEKSFEFIQTALSHLNTTVLYIEPNMNTANRFLEYITILHEKLTTWFPNIISLSIAPDKRFQWYDSITGNTPKSAIILKQYSRE